MRKVVVMLLVALLVCGMASAEIYPNTYIVVAVDQQEDVIVLEDFNGNVWVWEGAEDWFVGDVASALMDDQNTGSIYDDEILMLRYTGYLTED